MLNKSPILLTGIIMILGSFFCNVSAQDQPGKKDSLVSTILNEKRFIQVVLPEKYKPGSTDKYDVIYVLDGDGNTKLASDMQRFIEGEGYMPPVIIVGVLNVDRDRDLTPTHAENNRTSGGAGKFLSFLKNELIPYVNKSYPSNGENVVFGHSFGGLFVMYALLNEPQVFKSYIAADPSFWWDNRYMNKQATDKLTGTANLNRVLYITGREGEAYAGMGIVAMDSIIKAKAPADLVWKSLAYPEETHGSVRLKSMYDGLKFSYSGYNTKGPEFHPMAGILQKNKPVKIWDFDDSTKVRYTVDGTTPTIASARVAKVMIMSGPGTLTAKAFTGYGRYDKMTTGIFKEGSGPAPVKKGKNFQPGGFHYAYYEGEWDKLPDFKTLKPIREGITDTSFDIGKLPRKTNFGVVIEGQMEVKEEGYYIFALASDDGSKFYFNNQLLLDDDGLHGNDDTKSYILPLKKGFYPVRVEYFQKGGGAGMKFMYLTPQLVDAKEPKPITIPLALQYSAR